MCVSIVTCISIIAEEDLDIPVCTMFFLRPTRNPYTLTVLSALIISSIESSRMKVPPVCVSLPVCIVRMVCVCMVKYVDVLLHVCVNVALGGMCRLFRFSEQNSPEN